MVAISNRSSPSSANFDSCQERDSIFTLRVSAALRETHDGFEKHSGAATEKAARAALWE